MHRAISRDASVVQTLDSVVDARESGLDPVQPAFDPCNQLVDPNTAKCVSGDHYAQTLL